MLDNIFPKTENLGIITNYKKFDELDLSLFRSRKYKTLITYLLSCWASIILKIILLGSDIYTCIKLLAFNTWSNDYIQPYLPFRISKWLYSGCIIFSIVLLLWEVYWGIRIYRTRNICLTFVNNFCRSIYCLQNYSIYCLFDKITPNGVFQKMAFFTYFEIQSSFRLIFADSPRQVINGLTLWSVLMTKNADTPNNLNDINSFHGIIQKIRRIAKSNYEEAVILSVMLFSFMIWAFFILKLLFAVILSFRIYYKLIHSWNFNGLKEFVCVTISYNLDYLAEKYKYKKFYSQVSLLNDSSSDEDDESLYSSYLPTQYNDEIGRLSLLKTPGTLNTIPSYYYTDDNSNKLDIPREVRQLSHVYTPTQAYFTYVDNP